MLRLVTIPISHYCEKARWALERAGLDYREERHVQAIHRFAVRRAGGGLTVPVLVTPDGSIGELALILDWVNAQSPAELRLFPSTAPERREVLEMCRRFDERLGPSGRRLMYVHMFTDRELALRYNNQGVPTWEDRALRWGWRPITAVVKHVLEIKPGVEVGDEATVWREFDFVADRLADGRPYLSGERFGAADLTFAALSAPLTLPAIYGATLPQPEVLSKPTAALIRRVRAHPAGCHALRMFAEHRPAPPRGAALVR